MLYNLLYPNYNKNFFIISLIITKFLYIFPHTYFPNFSHFHYTIKQIWFSGLLRLNISCYYFKIYQNIMGFKPSSLQNLQMLYLYFYLSWLTAHFSFFLCNMFIFGAITPTYVRKFLSWFIHSFTLTKLGNDNFLQLMYICI